MNRGGAVHIWVGFLAGSVFFMNNSVPSVPEPLPLKIMLLPFDIIELGKSVDSLTRKRPFGKKTMPPPCLLAALMVFCIAILSEMVSSGLAPKSVTLKTL
ncbi:hypothetical protein D3C84_803080 [compost metagenome]